MGKRRGWGWFYSYNEYRYFGEMDGGHTDIFHYVTDHIIWLFVEIRCRVFGHDLEETGNPESGLTHMNCKRCGWGATYFMN